MKRKMGKFLRKSYAVFDEWRMLSNSYQIARRTRELVIRKKGHSVVDKKLEKQIKRYSADFFGSKKPWIWLALYTELRGEFFEGWLPDDVYSVMIIPTVNKKSFSLLSTVKTNDHKLFSGFAIEPLGVKVNGQVFDSRDGLSDEKKLMDYLKGYDDEIVIKRDGVKTGNGILFCQSSQVSPEFLNHGGDYVIQPSVQQQTVLRDLFPHSINTIRVTTFIDQFGNVNVKHVSLRFGSGRDRIVNSSGLFVYLNEEGKVVSNAHDDIGLDRGCKHPNTGVEYKSLEIPSIRKAIRLCKHAHLNVPYTRFIGWDLFINQENEPKLIEWNAMRPDMWVNEALIGPLWTEEELNTIIDEYKTKNKK